MVAIREIEQFGKRIGEEFGAEKVILFGSYAQGAAKQDSDIDLLVVSSFVGILDVGSSRIGWIL